MGDKGKKDKGKREDQKKSQNTLKEKRKQKKEKAKSIWGNGNSHKTKRGRLWHLLEK